MDIDQKIAELKKELNEKITKINNHNNSIEAIKGQQERLKQDALRIDGKIELLIEQAKEKTN